MGYQPGHHFKTNGRIGKIRSLPLAIRTEVNRRLDDGQSAPDIVAWLNTQEEVRRILNEKWEGHAMHKDNISSWRQKDYQQWVRRREKLETLRDLSEYALKLGQAAGGSMADGSAAIAGGRILATLETTSDGDIHKMVRSISELRSGDIRKAQLKQNEQKLELLRKRQQRQSVEQFVKWYADQKARDIVESRANNAEKIEILGRRLFGEDW